MKTVIIYTSQTGFTKRYANWLAQKVQGDILTIDEAKKKKDDFFTAYDAIVYGGWAMAGSVVQSKWFLEKAAAWKEKKLAIFCVGASPMENPDVETALHNLLTDEQREYIKAFYFQGGLDYSKMKMPSKLAMKAFASMLAKNKNPSESEQKMAEMISRSYDISDEKYVEPIVEYLVGGRDM
ncbi:MAG: flavodoxin domain-containing protein [Lachnospiraceae bacterium]